MDDVLVVVIAQAATQLLVVHLGLVLPDAPAPSDLVRVDQLELPAVSSPADDRLARLLAQQLEQEVPELDGSAACQHGGLNDGLVRGGHERGVRVRVDEGPRACRAVRGGSV